MAKYSITMSCGHDEMVELFGPMKERERKIKWFNESGLCKKCYEEKCEKEKLATEEKRESRLKEGNLSFK